MPKMLVVILSISPVLLVLVLHIRAKNRAARKREVEAKLLEKKPWNN